MSAAAGPATELPARERILEAACDLIADAGLDEVRIARVARRAGASTALVHHYFSTREELLEQALLHSFDRVADERFGDRRAEPPPADETAIARLARLVDECLPLPGAQEREWVLWVELWLRAMRDPSLRPVAGPLPGLDRGHDPGRGRRRRVRAHRSRRARRPGDRAARRVRGPGDARRPRGRPRAGPARGRGAARRRAADRPAGSDPPLSPPAGRAPVRSRADDRGPPRPDLVGNRTISGRVSPRPGLDSRPEIAPNGLDPGLRD